MTVCRLQIGASCILTMITIRLNMHALDVVVVSLQTHMIMSMMMLLTMAMMPTTTTTMIP